MSPRPSQFADPIIEHIHAKRGPFALADIRHACRIKDTKTVKAVMERLVTLRYIRYIDSRLMTKNWHITNKWPESWQGCKLVKDDYLTMRIVERGARALRRPRK